MIVFNNSDYKCFSKIETLEKIREFLHNEEVPEKEFKLNKTEKDVSRTIDSLQPAFYKGL